MDDWNGALKHFKKHDPVLHGAALPHLNAFSVRVSPKHTNDQLFAKLAASVVSQQLATKAAESIWKRVVAVCGGKVTHTSVLKTPLPRLRSAGLSAAKAKTLKELASAVRDGLKLTTLRTLSQEDATARLTTIWGIGPWTAEMFLMFALGRPDIFSARDLGLVRSMETLYGFPRGVALIELEKHAERWSPYRTYACLVLWQARDQG